MEFKFRAIDDNKKPPPPTTSHSLSPVSYLPDQSLQMNGNFSGLSMPLSGEAALRREIEKEQIRREILRRMELEEEVRRELAMEKELGISLPRPLMNMNMPGLMSHWSNSTLMNPAAVAHIDASQPSSILPRAEINPSPEISDKGKVIVLDKPDPGLFNAKRKATTVSEIEPFAFSLKKKPKKEWICALCEIRATNESGLNAHLNGRKHRAREAGQNGKIAKRNNKSGENVKATQTVVATTELGADVEKDQQLLQPCTALVAMNETLVDKGIEESEKEGKLVKTVVGNDTSATESKNDKFVAMMVGKNMTESKNEELLGDAEKDQQLVQPYTALEGMNEIVVDKGVEESKNEEQLVKKVADDDTSATESKNDKFVAMMVRKNITESKNEELLWETVADNGASVKSTKVDMLVEMMVSNDVINCENGGLLAEKSQSVGCLESKKDAAIVEAEKISASTKRRKVGSLWCEICQISTFSKAVMEGHVKGRKHIKKMKKFGQNNVSPPSTSSVSQKAPSLINDA